MAALDTEREIRELKRRLDLLEERLSQIEDRFGPVAVKSRAVAELIAGRDKH